MTFTRFAFFSLLASAAAADHLQQPKKSPVLNEITSQGCFDSLPNDMISGRNSTFNSVGTCADYCQEQNTEVALLQGKACFCSHSYPPEDSQVDDDQCDVPCPGYTNDACGGKDAFSVYNLGVELLPGDDDDGESKGETTATSTAPLSTKSAATTTVHSASTTVSTSGDTEKVSATESEQGSVSTAAVEEPSKVANSASDSVVSATPSASTITNNGALRFSNPIGNAVRLMRQFLE